MTSLNPILTNRLGASVNAYLILKQGENVLLLLRQNTGYYDGFYGLPAGHVENGESATEGMLRETYEEIGITLNSSNLQVLHVMHRQSNRFNVDIFFQCSLWEGKIENREIEKCASLEFHPLHELPSNTIPYIADALQAISKGICYSEQGWS
ncbi:MAG: NUDIX domain-containing protein [Simkania negevensis]|nr:NUDIX domain-containing protein [Simkania negevensis]